MNGGNEPGFPEGEDMRQRLFDKVCGCLLYTSSVYKRQALLAVVLGHIGLDEIFSFLFCHFKKVLGKIAVAVHILIQTIYCVFF